VEKNKKIMKIHKKLWIFIIIIKFHTSYNIYIMLNIKGKHKINHNAQPLSASHRGR